MRRKATSLMYKVLIATASCCCVVVHSALYAQEQGITFHTSSPNDTPAIRDILDLAKNAATPEQAIRLYEEAQRKSDKINYTFGILKSINGLGVSYLHKNHYAKAQDYFNDALRYIKSNGVHQDFLPGIYSNKASLFSETGQYDSAINYYLKAIAQIGDYDISDQVKKAAIYNNLGSLFNSLHQYVNARNYLLKAIEAAGEIKDYSTLSRAYNALSYTYMNMGGEQNYKQAETYLQQAIAIAKEAQSPALMSSNLITLGNLYVTKLPQRQQHIEQALSAFRQAQALDTAYPYKQLIIKANIGNCLSLLHRFNEAEPMLLESLGQAQVINAQFKPVILAMIARMYRAQNKHEEAGNYYDQYLELTSNKDNETIKERALKTQYLYEAKEKENEVIKKELELSRQAIHIQRKNTLAYSIAGIAIALSCIGLLYFRYRRRLEKIAEKQRLEKASWKATLEGEERERKRLAKELHDNIGGNLSTIKTWLANINQRKSRDGVQERDVADVEQLVSHTLTEVRNTAHHLMPELLLRLGLVEAVRIYCLNVQKAAHIDFQFHYLGYIGDLGKELELIIYRVIQELVQNIVKHSGATSALVQMSLHETKLSITIEDNGKGIEDPGLTEHVGIGLMNIQTTVEYMGGQFSISSEKGNGTTVEIELDTENTLTDKSSII